MDVNRLLGGAGQTNRCGLSLEAAVDDKAV